MSLVSKIKKIRDVLVELEGINVYHYWREVKKDRYIIWAEDSEASSFHADNRHQEQVIHGTIDLYTKVEYDAIADAIQDALAEACKSFRLDSVMYEDETGYIHYSWEWEVV